MTPSTITSADSLLRQTRSLLRTIRPSGWAVELFWEEEHEWEKVWADGRPKGRSYGVGAGLAVRVIKNGRWGFAAGTDTSSVGVRTLFDRACVAAQSLSPDNARVLPSPVRGKRTAPSWHRGESVGSFQEVPFHENEAWDTLHRLERRAKGFDRRIKKAIGLSFHEAAGVRALASTTGLAVAEPWNAVSFSAEVLAIQSNETETAWGSAETTDKRHLEPEKVVDDICARLVTSFGARPLLSGKWTVLVNPRVGGDLLELMSQAVMGDAVEKGRSFLARRMGQRVGSPLVTIIDDGRWPDGVASRVWDDEGVPQQRTEVIGQGRLRSFLHDSATARRARGNSTGNASRSGYADPPAPGNTNFYLEPGSSPVADLYRDTPKAFEVRDVIGLHTADTVSGDFSVGATGVLWEKGRPRHAVRGVTLSGNLSNVLSDIDAVADTLVWQGSFGAPLFRVKELFVGGH